MGTGASTGGGLAVPGNINVPKAASNASARGRPAVYRQPSFQRRVSEPSYLSAQQYESLLRTQSSSPVRERAGSLPAWARPAEEGRPRRMSVCVAEHLEGVLRSGARRPTGTVLDLLCEEDLASFGIELQPPSGPTSFTDLGDPSEGPAPPRPRRAAPAPAGLPAIRPGAVPPPPPPLVSPTSPAESTPRWSVDSLSPATSASGAPAAGPRRSSILAALTRERAHAPALVRLPTELELPPRLLDSATPPSSDEGMGFQDRQVSPSLNRSPRRSPPRLGRSPSRGLDALGAAPAAPVPRHATPPAVTISGAGRPGSPRSPPLEAGGFSRLAPTSPASPAFSGYARRGSMDAPAGNVSTLSRRASADPASMSPPAAGIKFPAIGASSSPKGSPLGPRPVGAVVGGSRGSPMLAPR
eukprot:tig00020830_g14411.t1